MGAIKDLLDITTQLINSVEDRRVAAELGKILSLIASVQSDHFEARERNIQLLAENVRLQQELSDLRSSHARELSDLHASHAQTIATLNREHSETKAKSNQEHAAEIARIAANNGEQVFD